jgi:hypothetical protein
MIATDHYYKWVAEFQARPTELFNAENTADKLAKDQQHPEDIIGKVGLYAMDTQQAHRMLIRRLQLKNFTLISFSNCELLESHQQRVGYHIATDQLTSALSYEKPIEFSYQTVKEKAQLAASAGAEGTQQSELLSIEKYDIPALAHDPELSYWEQPWIAEALKPLLFNQPVEQSLEKENVDAEGEKQLEPTIKPKTYLLLDAAARKRITKIFDIDEIPGMDVEIKCLFKGEAAETYEEVAPYLVDMTLPEGAYNDADLVPEFHKDYFKKHWEISGGIFIRSNASMTELVQHYRKFIQIPDEQGKWYWLRFWDCRIMHTYITNIATDHDRITRWLVAKQGALIQAIIRQPENEIVTVATPHNTFLGKVNDSAFRFTKLDFAIFEQDSNQKFIKKLGEYMAEEHPVFAALDQAEQRKQINTMIDTAKRLGFTIEQAIADYVNATLLSDHALLSDPVILELLGSNHHQLDKARFIEKQAKKIKKEK